jgi:hypothetical protein
MASVQEQTASMESLAQSAQGLSEMSERLLGVVSKFVLEENMVDSPKDLRTPNRKISTSP